MYELLMPRAKEGLARSTLQMVMTSILSALPRRRVVGIHMPGLPLRLQVAHHV